MFGFNSLRAWSRDGWLRFGLFMLIIGVLLIGLGQAFAASPPTLRVCTGDPNLRYFKTANDLGEQLRGVVKIDAQATTGSLDNLRKMSAGECDGAIVQSDAYLNYAATTPNAALKVEDVGGLYSEYAQLLCNKDAGIGSLSDLAKKPSTKVAVGPAGSGSALTWDNLARVAPAYGKVNTVPLPNDLALTRVIKGQDAQCLFVVSGLNTTFMKKANDLSAGKIGLVPFDDRGFAKIKDALGHGVYGQADIPADAYSNLSPSGTFWGHTSIPTITVSAEMVILTDWYEKNSAAYGDLSTAVLRLGQRNAQ